MILVILIAQIARLEDYYDMDRVRFSEVVELYRYCRERQAFKMVHILPKSYVETKLFSFFFRSEAIK